MTEQRLILEAIMTQSTTDKVNIIVNQEPCPILRVPASKITPLQTDLTSADEDKLGVWDKTVHEFGADLIAACKHMEANCLGLAANQIWEGEPPYPAMFCMRWPSEDYSSWEWKVIINPEIQPTGKKQKVVEGCLSLMHPNPISKKKLRKSNVTLKYQTLNDPYQKTRRFMGNLGPYPRIIQHECDHLNGKLCID